jgi:hypothetical protein
MKVSAQAARALARRLRLPRQKANDGKTLVTVDLAEIDHKPKPAAVRSSDDDQVAALLLMEKVTELKELLAKATRDPGGSSSRAEMQNRENSRVTCLQVV